VASITADNCSNVLAALKMEGEDTMIVYPDTLEILRQDSVVEENEETQPQDGGMDLLELLDTCDLYYEDGEDSWVEFTIALRNACLAHLLQLGIKDRINFSKLVKDLIKRINDIVNYFHKSNFWYSKLRKEIQISLLKACTTRWNSQYHCLKRIFGEKRVDVRIYYQT
jgi:hypothetical protein